MAFEFIAVGDLHYDNKLSSFIPDINSVITEELRVALEYARQEGVKFVVLLGDIGDSTRLSEDALIRILTIASEYRDLKILMYPGNHDTVNSEVNGLNVIGAMIDALADRSSVNIRVVTQPTTLRVGGGERVRILPWPHFSVDRRALNFAHVETNGSMWEHGKTVETERDTIATVISGHLHNAQEAGPNKNIKFPGTLYQKSFGERAKKFFARGLWQDGKLVEYELIPHAPKYTLHNIVIASEEDFKKISDDPYSRYKAYIKSDVILSPNTLAQYPTLVKHNSFKTRAELEALIADELLLQDAGVAVNTLSVMDALNKWMLRASVNEELQDRARVRLEKILGKASRREAAETESKGML